MTCTMWTFKTKNFTVRWEVDYDLGYQYDGDDEFGETQAALDCGSMVAFDSTMTVLYRGCEIGTDHLGASVYYSGEAHTFRDHIGMNARGHGSYFSDMVRGAIAEARRHMADAPQLRRITA